MRVVGSAGVDGMVAAFLHAEARSSRFGESGRAVLASHGADLGLVECPDNDDPAANATRRRVLAAYRGLPDREVFAGIPANTDWLHILFAPADLDSIRYINWGWWLEVTGGSRRPADAAHYYQHHPICREIASQIAAGSMPPPIIVVARPGPTDLVVLEGHIRLTAMHLAAPHLPPEIPAILGISPDMDK